MRKFTFALVTMSFVMSSLYAQEYSKKELDHWLNNPDAPLPVRKKHREINEGKLQFLDPVKFNSVMHSQNNITISRDSLGTGWVRLNQCYRQLEPFPRVQIVYKYRNIRDLKILNYHKIASAKVQGKSVQLTGVKKGASICVKARIQSLQKTASGYQLKNGPFRRKFFDGYFPLRVSVKVTFPVELIKLIRVTPASKPGEISPGLRIKKSRNQINLDATFEGVLNTRIDFAAIKH